MEIVLLLRVTAKLIDIVSIWLVFSLLLTVQSSHLPFDTFMHTVFCVLCTLFFFLYIHVLNASVCDYVRSREFSQQVSA